MEENAHTSCLNTTAQYPNYLAIVSPFFSLFFYFYVLIGVHLIYNAVFISAVQHSDSIIHTYTFLFRFFSCIGYYKILRIVPCAIQQVSVGFLFFNTAVCIC